MFVFPMVGKSSRFFSEGFSLPKYQLKINGVSVFSKVVKSFERYFSTDSFLFIVRTDYGAAKFVEAELKTLGVNDFSIVEIPYETKGQAETVYIGLKDFMSDEPLFIFNIDTFRPGFSKPDFINVCDGYLEVFEAKGEQWSFAEPGPNGQVVRTAEKKRISDLCSDGLYFFKTKELFDAVFVQSTLDKSTTKGEYYIAPLYNYLIKEGKDIRYVLVSKEEVVICGTPEDYRKLI